MSFPKRPGGAAFYSLAALASLLALPFGASRGLRAPTDLRCEYDANPIGLDETAPRLSWQVNDDRRGATQTAYQVVVAGSLDDLERDRGTLWDSGKIASDQSVWVAYEGKPLVSRQACYWKVRTWDAGGKASPYSKPALWEMGLLRADEWDGQWITAAEADHPAALGSWLWHPTDAGSGSRVFLRRTFEVSGDIAGAQLRLAADNHALVLVNGQEIGRHDAWDSVADLDVA